MNMKRATWIVIVLLALEPHVPALQERPEKFVIGMLRRDGIVTPFAMFDGSRWRSRWPVDIRNQELPISLDDVPGNWWGLEPAPRTMTIWRDARRVGSLNLTGVALSRLMCQPRVTLKSDYKAASPVPPPFEAPYPKDGIVVAGDARLEPIESIEKGSADWNRVLILITESFNREESVAAREFTDWTHPVRERDRRLVPITIEAIYRAATKYAVHSGSSVAAR